ncbi:MAG: TetR/AcrR family transcriptional regulator, partial [Gemmatimonadetes bacterium]|nr:TetR/AcrR family transcriptional regulator [Gemmatimonadota bacterium]
SVWREQGYRDATTLKVAERAGIGEVTLFRRFGGKGKLFAAALAREAESFEIAALASSDDVEADLLNIVCAYDRLLDRNGAIVADFLLNRPNDPAFDELAAIPRSAIMKAVGIIVYHQQAGRLQSGPPLQLIVGLLGPLIMSYMIQRAQPELGLGAAPHEIVSRFLNGSA